VDITYNHRIRAKYTNVHVTNKPTATMADARERLDSSAGNGSGVSTSECCCIGQSIVTSLQDQCSELGISLNEALTLIACHAYEQNLRMSEGSRCSVGMGSRRNAGVCG